tara:strand:- start:8202 stop:9359 length:1158 start_codon:yes stop_codon:yes gene_type:complete
MKLVLFGIGTIAEKTLKKIKEKPSLIVDNNPGTWGMYFAGVKVQSPKVLEGMDSAQVIICTTSYKDVIIQLTGYGLSNFQVSPILKNVVESDRIEDITFDLLFVSGLPSTKNKLSGGGIFRVKGSFDSYKIEKIKAGNCHGIAVNEEDPDEIYVTDTSQGVVVLNRKDLSIKRIIKYDLTLRPHGIFVKSSSQIYLACSYEDAIYEIDQNGKNVKQFSIRNTPEKYSDGLAQHHINDMSFYEGNLYATMFSATGSWQQGFLDGAIKKIDVKTGHVSTVFSDLQMPHNIQVDNTGMKFCNSLTGEVYTNNRQVVFRGNGFVRGLFECENYFIVGESKNRNFASIESPILNNCLDTRLNFVDKSTLAYKSLQLPIEISEIHGILNLS